jgi:hypothetical protein
MKNHAPSLRKNGTPKTVNIARETEIQLQALMSEELEEEDESLEEETNFSMPIIPREIVMSWKISNPNDLPSSSSPDEEDSKEQTENPMPSQDPSIEESQDEEDLPIVLHAENIGRRMESMHPSSSLS